MNLLLTLLIGVCLWEPIMIRGSTEPTIKTVYQACIDNNLLYPEIVTAQSILETGYYSSKVCKEYNNILGLYNSRTNSYYQFSHWKKCIRQYKKLVEYKYKPIQLSEEEYLVFLETLPYALDSMYTKKIKILVAKHF